MHSEPQQKYYFEHSNLLENGCLSPAKIAVELKITDQKLAVLLNLDKDAFSTATELQKRLQEAVAVFEQVAPWCSSAESLVHWYESQPIPSLGHRTPAQMMQNGKSTMLFSYLRRIEVGGYA